MKKEAKRQLNKVDSPTKTSNKSKEKKLKRFNKAQLESIRNSPMVVRKREEAEKFFSSPGYKAYERERAAKKKIKGRKKKSQ